MATSDILLSSTQYLCNLAHALYIEPTLKLLGIKQHIHINGTQRSGFDRNASKAYLNIETVNAIGKSMSEKALTSQRTPNSIKSLAQELRD